MLLVSLAIVTHVGDVILMVRKRAGKSQIEVAERAGIHPATLSRIEKDSRRADQQTLEAIAGALGTTLAKLYESVPEAEKESAAEREEEELMSRFSENERSTLERVAEHPNRDALFSMLATYLDGTRRKQRA